ncbi:HNH endonuclease [Cellulomonas rhizosphaerae]|uniref:HNH endonuclease n=2 Tax=Cellulomonas rhizosphaerae TaxID=2293719 RepID=A0A413RMB1_9CELL|nr:HNH endonuclease [Cellulomonas rhizosphaerae]
MAEERASGFVSSSRAAAPRVDGDPFAPGDADMTQPVFPVRASVGEIVRHIEQLTLDELSPRDALEIVAAWQQVINMAVAGQSDAITHLVGHPGPLGDYVEDEIAAALTLTSHSAGVLADRAAGVAAHQPLRDALRAGTIDGRKVDVILKETFPLVEGEMRDEVVARAVEESEGLTAPQLARVVRRECLAADPSTAKVRHERAKEDRSIELTWRPDSMASFGAFVPAGDAVAAYTALDALAEAAKGPGDTRTVDQRRADAFADVFRHILDTGQTAAGAHLATRHGRKVALNVTVAASTLMGLDDLPGELESYGPIPAHIARELAQDGTWRRILTDPRNGELVERGRATYRPGADLTGTVLARDVTCTAPGCRQPAARCEIDHLVPFDKSRPADEQTTEDNLGAGCKHHHQSKTDKVWNATRDPVTGICTWTSPLGITYSRAPVRVFVAPKVFDRRPPPPAPPGEDDPPPF